MAYKILMVEDDSSIAAGLSYALEKEGYLVTLCRKISQAFEEIKTVHFDLALLDIAASGRAGERDWTEASGRTDPGDLSDCGG